MNDVISFNTKGNFNNTLRYLKRIQNFNFSILDKYGEIGVEALKNATPKNTGLASESWYYKIIKRKNSVSLAWFNSDVENGFMVAISIQYGHGTKDGKWIDGIDYINPAIVPIFKQIEENIWKEITYI